jgi:hypothetical protein
MANLVVEAHGGASEADGTQPRAVLSLLPRWHRSWTFFDLQKTFRQAAYAL